MFNRQAKQWSHQVRKSNRRDYLREHMQIYL